MKRLKKSFSRGLLLPLGRYLTHSEAFTDVATRSGLNKDIGTWRDSLPNVGELSRKVYPLPSDPRASPNMNGDSGAWITHPSQLRSPPTLGLVPNQDKDIKTWVKLEPPPHCFVSDKKIEAKILFELLSTFDETLVQPLHCCSFICRLFFLSQRNPQTEKQAKLHISLEPTLFADQLICSFNSLITVLFSELFNF